MFWNGYSELIIVGVSHFMVIVYRQDINSDDLALKGKGRVN